MTEFKRIAVDTSKSVFTLHGVGLQDQVMLRRDFKRAAFIAFIAKQAPTEVVLEACGGSHHWGRMLIALGHRVKLIPPQYVKPYVKRGFTDRRDAEAICEAAGRPGMSFVPVKSAQRQADLMVQRSRELLVSQRTQLVNALRGHATEFGVIVGKGIERVDALLGLIAADTAIPIVAREVMAMLGSKTASVWLLNLLERRPRKLAAVALANKMARIIWAMMSTGEAYRGISEQA